MRHDDNRNSTDDQAADSSQAAAQGSEADDGAGKSAKPDDNRQASEPSVLDYNPQDYTDDRGTTSGQTLPVQNGPITGSDTKLPA